MERIRRVAVHAHEAMEMASDPDDVDRLRLSLLLFDSAAELLLHRECEYRLRWNQIARRNLEALEQLRAARHELSDEELADVRQSVVSKSKARNINRSFTDKLDYLVEVGQLDGSRARVVAKLHGYRNDSYHRDRVRSGTLLASVQLYGFLVCQLMETFRVRMVRMVRLESDPLSAPLRDLAASGAGSSFGLDLQATLGAGLAERWAVTADVDVADALADHAEDRLGELRDTIDWVTREAVARFGDPRWDGEATVRYVQLPDDTDPSIPVESIRTAAVSIGLSHVVGWERRAVELRTQPDAVMAFGEFADIEDELEKLEGPLHRLAAAIDEDIQHQIDVARGK